MDRSAYALRENTGTSDVLETARADASALAGAMDCWVNSPAKRLRDKADVTELILRRKLPHDLAVAAPVRNAYLELWDSLQAEA